MVESLGGTGMKGFRMFEYGSIGWPRPRPRLTLATGPDQRVASLTQQFSTTNIFVETGQTLKHK